jgi:hypothetical protein
MFKEAYVEYASILEGHRNHTDRQILMLMSVDELQNGDCWEIDAASAS